MWNLAIECSGVTGSVALCSQGCARLEWFLPENLGSVQSLSRTIEQMLRELELDCPNLISVSVGPGSFTGLRVGLATAKLMAMAWGIPIVPVDTLETIAQGLANRSASHSALDSGVGQSATVLLPVLNAFRKQVFVGGWLAAGGEFRRIAPSQVQNAVEWQARPLKSLYMSGEVSGDQESYAAMPQVIAGPGLQNYRPAELPGQRIAEESLWTPRASMVAELGWKTFGAGGAVNAAELTANYVRASAAEESLRT